MVDLEQLAVTAHRVATWSRARMAVRIAVPIAAVAIGLIATGGDAWGCTFLAIVLFAVSAALRWWRREGVRAVWLGLAMGVVPLITSFLLPPCGAQCISLGGRVDVDVVCVAAGAAAGIGLAVLSDRARHAWRPWMLSSLVAALTAALGCMSLGATSLLATMVPLIATSSALQLPLRYRQA